MGNSNSNAVFGVVQAGDRTASGSVEEQLALAHKTQFEELQAACKDVAKTLTSFAAMPYPDAPQERNDISGDMMKWGSYVRKLMAYKLEAEAIVANINRRGVPVRVVGER